MKTLEQLIAEAKIRQSNDARSKNKGRPRKGMPKDQAKIVSAMRQKGIQIMTIHSLLKENNMTQYQNYGTFLAAYKEYKLHN